MCVVMCDFIMKEELLMTAVKTCYNPTRHPRSRSRSRFRSPSPSLSICFFSYSLLSLFNILLIAPFIGIPLHINICCINLSLVSCREFSLFTSQSVSQSASQPYRNREIVYVLRKSNATKSKDNRHKDAREMSIKYKTKDSNAFVLHYKQLPTFSVHFHFAISTHQKVKGVEIDTLHERQDK
ncbi:hypothetical protein GQX74_003782 [Glossina fuscipes]|nr:hypothetical protein GQX74_003782 [Glossina fuscipes]